MVARMPNEVLVSTVKKIVSLARDGKLDEAYGAYEQLFSGSEFSSYEPADQRQALRIMILAKTPPKPPTPAMLRAHKAAEAPLGALVAAHGEPSDHELLGICQLIGGDSESASTTFRAGLTLERAKNPGSDLCGNLMKRVSLI